MPKTFNGEKQFPLNFDVQITRPLDNRLVVDSYEDLINGTIEYPYQGMVVSIAGKSELWVFTGVSREDSRNRDNWKLVTGSAKDSGNGLSKYSIPVMTPEMVAEAEADEYIDFDGSEDPYILIENDFHPTKSQGDPYLRLIGDMSKAIMALQAEVTRLRNTFEFGIDSYTNTKTAKSRVVSELDDTETIEPLWGIDSGIGLMMVPDNTYFNTLLDQNHKFIPIGKDRDAIDYSVEGQLTFVDCKGAFYDGNDTDVEKDKLTLYNLTDSKLITYLVTDKPDIEITLVSLDDNKIIRPINLSTLISPNMVQKYGYCIVLGRKVKDTKDDKYYGFNYIYISVINYNTNTVLAEGYLNNNDTLVDGHFVDTGEDDTFRRVLVDDNGNELEVPYRYSIKSIVFDRLTLSRMKFYTKYEDFSEEVKPIAPNEQDYKYEVAHIAIRSVKDKAMLDSVADHLRDNELIWNKETNTLHIKSNGKIYSIGSKSEDDKQKDDNMTDKEIIEALVKMGIVVNVKYKTDEHGDETDEIESLNNISLAPVSDITFINEDTNKKFTFSVNPEGNLVGKDKSAQTIDEFLGKATADSYKTPSDTYRMVRGFSSDYLFRKGGATTSTVSTNLNSTKDTGKKSDRLRISSFYAPIVSDEKHGCTHSFIELENTSTVDIPLTGVYLHFFNPSENTYVIEDNKAVLKSNNVHHLELDGVIPAGGTYLIRGAKHAEFDDESAFIKVRTYDKEWYENGQLISFEQKPGKENVVAEDGSTVPAAYRFCLTYGLSDLSASKQLVEINNTSITIAGTEHKKAKAPNIIRDPRFIDSCSYSTLASISKYNGVNNPWYPNGSVDDKAGQGITIKPNTLFRLMFALDPAKQAFNGFNVYDSSRSRYNKATDIQILDLNKEFIGFPHSKETIRIDRYTPKASFEHKNVMTDKSQLNKEKPNMVTCSFGVDVYNTRCFNWISCGTFDECVWIRQHGTTTWNRFDSYTKVSSNAPENHSKSMYRKEYLKDVNNTVYARMINRFPGNDVLFTSHKCVVVLPDASTPTVYEYVVGRPDKDNNPDPEHTNSVYTFTVYPRDYEGRVYQVTDQQGFHWIEYQVWAASAEYLNTKIDQEVAAWNSTHTKKVFPILINTGDMTQSGARINEWLDYYNGGQCLFNHLEQMNVVGNNDLCPINPRDLGTGNDEDKSSSHFFHYFYCFDVRDTEKCTATVPDPEKPSQVVYTGEKFFTGESLIVKAHKGRVGSGDNVVEINVTDDKYIPSLYYFKTKGVLYVMVNSEIPKSNCQLWFRLCSNNNEYVSIYTGIEITSTGNYAGGQLTGYDGYFTPIYDTIYAWLNSNKDDEHSKKVIVAMHEMPFTVITNTSLNNGKDTKKWDQLPCTRNHPTNGNRLGSNVNQLDSVEKKGIYWCSRLLEWFNCKLVIGGHKHTYALSYPIKEKYSWTYTGVGDIDGIEKNKVYDSSEKTKPMSATLADEANGGDYNVSWDIDLTAVAIEDKDKPEAQQRTNKVVYNIDNSVPISGDNMRTLNSTKTPYIPSSLYVGTTGENLFRCCTPLSGTYTDKKYDGFVTYSMCQATGYKLKSNKELPAKFQLFSKIIPLTTHSGDTDSPNPNQLYPMYSVLEFNDDCSELSVSMNRITGIFASLGSDTFSQTSYGKGDLGVEMLCTGSDVAVADRMYGKWVSEDDMDLRDIDERYVHIKF